MRFEWVYPVEHEKVYKILAKQIIKHRLSHTANKESGPTYSALPSPLDVSLEVSSLLAAYSCYIFLISVVLA